MSLFHNSVAAERLALSWHVLGAVVSLNTALMALLAGWILWPWLGLHGTLGLLLFFLYLSLAIDVVIGAGGLLWHLWAVKQHRAHLDDLQS